MRPLIRLKYPNIVQPTILKTATYICNNISNFLYSESFEFKGIQRNMKKEKKI